MCYRTSSRTELWPLQLIHQEDIQTATENYAEDYAGMCKGLKEREGGLGGICGKYGFILIIEITRDK